MTTTTRHIPFDLERRAWLKIYKKSPHKKRKCILGKTSLTLFYPFYLLYQFHYQIDSRHNSHRHILQQLLCHVEELKIIALLNEISMSAGVYAKNKNTYIIKLELPLVR